MQTFLTIYLVAACLGSALALLAGLQIRRARVPGYWPPALDTVADGVTAEFGAGQPADVRDAAVVALNRLMPGLSECGVRIDVAIRPGLLVWESGHRLADVMERMLSVMLAGADRRVLLSAVRQGGQVAVCVANDEPYPDRQSLRARLQPLRDDMALQPARIEIESLSDDGASVMLRLNAASPFSRSEYSDEQTPIPAPVPAINAEVPP